MKKRARPQPFPALRFLRQRHVDNQRRMRLRNWTLLALRFAAVILLALALARPSIDSSSFGIWFRGALLAGLAVFALAMSAWCWVKKNRAVMSVWVTVSCVSLCGVTYFVFRGITTVDGAASSHRDVPIAAAIVFDTSPRSGLRHANITRLDEAKAIAKDLIAQLPSDSEVAIINSKGVSAFSPDTSYAVNIIESLEVVGPEEPFVDLVQRGIQLVSQKQDKRQEVYVLSEMSANVWEIGPFSSVREQLAESPQISLFVIDVGVERPINASLGELELNADTLVRGQELRISTRVHALNMTPTQVSVSVDIENQDPTRPVIIDDQVLYPESVTRKRKQIQLGGNSETPVDFQIRGLPLGVNHGCIQLHSQDGLEVDNRRYFTVEVRPPLPVLLATSKDAEPKYLELALSPTELEIQAQNVFECSVVDADRISAERLNDFSVVVLLDPGPLPSAVWSRLETFVRAGGGAAIFLGKNASPSATFNANALSVLPGPLATPTSPKRPSDAFLIALKNAAHPSLAPFRGWESNVPWDLSPVYRHWEFDKLNPSVDVVLRFSNGKPALVERVIGLGRVMTMTTPLSDANSSNFAPWNELPTSTEPLPFYMLAMGIFPYLATPSPIPLNQRVASSVQLPTKGDQTRCELFTPQLYWQTLHSNEGHWMFEPMHPGHHRLRFSDGQNRGFSVNLDPSSTLVERVAAERLREILGDRYTFAREPSDIYRGINRARIGRELFPFLLLCVVGILSAEHLLSNLFYPAGGRSRG